MISPTLPPVIMKDAITSVYSVIASWIPVTSVPTSLATVAIAVFITVISRAMTNCADANVSSTKPEALAAAEDAVGAAVTTEFLLRRRPDVLAGSSAWSRMCPLNVVVPSSRSRGHCQTPISAFTRPDVTAALSAS